MMFLHVNCTSGLPFEQATTLGFHHVPSFMFHLQCRTRALNEVTDDPGGLPFKTLAHGA